MRSWATAHAMPSMGGGNGVSSPHTDITACLSQTAPYSLASESEKGVDCNLYNLNTTEASFYGTNTTVAFVDTATG